MTLTVQLTDELRRQLRDRAASRGEELEEYVLHLIERDTSGSLAGEGRTTLDAPGVYPGQAALSNSEFEQLLGDLSSGPELPHLPANFSRADIYSDHD